MQGQEASDLLSPQMCCETWETSLSAPPFPQVKQRVHVLLPNHVRRRVVQL